MSTRVQAWKDEIRENTGLMAIFHPMTNAMSVYKKKKLIASYDDAHEIDPSTVQGWAIIFDLKCRTR